MVSSAIPVANIVVPILTPIIIAGLMLACRQQEQGGEISIGLVFSGFTERPGQLALIGLSYLLANFTIAILMVILIIIILGGIDSIAQFTLDNLEALLPHAISLLLAALIGLLLFIPVLMALWFSRALVVFHKISAIEAMLLSIKACLLNVLPFLIYGVLTMALMIIASVPHLLGWLILIPILIASIYISYTDVFSPSND